MKKVPNATKIIHWPFLLDIGRNVASSALLFAITAITTPLMTRLFPPEAYGINAMTIRVATILSLVGLLGMPIALAREREAIEQNRLLSTSLVLATIVATLSLFGALIAPKLIPGMPTPVVAIFPIIVFTYCANTTIQSFGTANGLFASMAKGRLGDGLGARSLSIGCGFALHAGAMTMLLADIAGKIIGSMAILNAGRSYLNLSTRSFVYALSRLKTTVHEYRYHATYANFATLLPLPAALLIEATIAARYGTERTGQYVLAFSILNLPIALIALASAPVIFHRLVEEFDRPDGRPAKLSMYVLLASLVVGAGCMAPVILYGPPLFSFFFGERWRSAGDVAQILALPLVFNFSFVALLGLLKVKKEAAKKWFFAELVSFCVFFTCVFLWRSDFENFVYLLAALYTLRFAIMHYSLLLSLRTD